MHAWNKKEQKWSSPSQSVGVVGSKSNETIFSVCDNDFQDNYIMILQLSLEHLPPSSWYNNPCSPRALLTLPTPTLLISNEFTEPLNCPWPFFRWPAYQLCKLCTAVQYTNVHFWTMYTVSFLTFLRLKKWTRIARTKQSGRADREKITLTVLPYLLTTF